MGDGTATAAVLLGAIVDGGARYLAAGGDAMRLRYYLEEALALALAALEKQTKPVNGKVALARVAESICADSELAALLGEIFDIIGAYGQLDIRADRGRRLRREYVEGMTWDGGVFARDMIQNSADLQTVYEEPALVLADFKVNDPRHIMPMLELAVDQEIKRLILVAADLGPSAIAGLMMANGKLKDFQVMAVRGPGKNAGRSPGCHGRYRGRDRRHTADRVGGRYAARCHAGAYRTGAARLGEHGFVWHHRRQGRSAAAAAASVALAGAARKQRRR